MFKSENVPTWLCVLLGLWQVVLQIIWRRQDSNQPVPDLRYLLSDIIIVIAILASWLLTRPRDPSRLIIHYAHYGSGKWWNYVNVTKPLRAMVRSNCLDILPLDEFGDPYPNQAKAFTVKYSYEGITRTISKADGRRLVLPGPDTAAGMSALEILKCEADGILHEYKHLDHDHRDDVGLPLSNSSWPKLGVPWSHVDFRLAVLYERLDIMVGLSKALCKRNNWTEEYIHLFKLNQSTKMLDLISALEEFLSWKPSASRTL